MLPTRYPSTALISCTQSSHIAGVRPVFELQRLRWRGRAPHSDADQLSRLTGVPALVWVGLFLVIAAGSLAAGGYLLAGTLIPTT